MHQHNPPPVITNPFRGLAKYKRNDPLFARDKDVELIQSRLWSSRITVMFAGSGVGKTSFLDARLVPALEAIFQREHVAVPHLHSWARVDPRRELIDAKQQVLAAKPTRRGSIIILDQFEEVFQSFPTPTLLREFGQELATIADEESTLNIRLLISIREDFLADLTSLDDFLPAVLTNYYRLRRLSTRQAKLIIEKTARLSGIETSANVDLLIRDLSSLGRGPQADAGTFVDPPYLQIVCQSVWANEQPSPAQPFLSSYEPGQAERELDAYCREKLKPLSAGERVLVRKALEHLTGPHEAKKFRRVSELAREARLRNTPALVEALDVLAGDDVKILRRWEESPLSAWAQNNPGKPRLIYQLYHDMYAPELWRWKEEQASTEKRRSVVKALLAAAALSFFVLWPVWNRVLVLRSVNAPTYASGSEFSTVLSMRNAFGLTVLARWIGDLTWRQYTDKLITLSALRLDMDAAIGYRLASLTTSGRKASRDDATAALGPGRYLAATIERLPGAIDAVLVPETSKVVIGNFDGEIVEWEESGLKASRKLQIPDESADPFGTTLNGPLAGGVGIPTKLLCLSHDGQRAVAAWYAHQPASGPKVLIAMFSTATGRLVWPARPLPLAVAEAPRSAARARVPVPAPSMSPSVIFSLGGVCDATGERVAVLSPELTAVYAENAEWIIPKPVEQFVFLPDGKRFATASSPGIRTTQGAGIEWWIPEGTGRVVAEKTAGLTPTLPWPSRLVVNDDGDVLAAAGNEWQWVSPTSRRAQALAFAPYPATAPERHAYPQAFDSKSGILLLMDGNGRLVLHALTPSQPSKFALLPITERRGALVASTRVMTGASLSRFDSRRVVTIDNDGTVARLWRLPETPDPSAEIEYKDLQDSGTEPRHSARCPDDGRARYTTYCSVDDQWAARVPRQVPEGTRTTIEVAPIGTAGGTPWHISVASTPRAVMVAVQGARVLLLYGNAVEYIERDAPGHVLRTTKQVQQAAFGPGAHRVTLLTADEIIIHNRQTWDSEGEWQAACAGKSSSLVLKPDESSVLVHSTFWLHRIRMNESRTSRMVAALSNRRVWPDITTVQTDVPISADHFIATGSGDKILKQLGREIRESEERFSRTDAFDGSVSIGRWFESLHVNTCRSGPSKDGAWRNVLCGWEIASARRTGAGGALR